MRTFTTFLLMLISIMAFSQITFPSKLDEEEDYHLTEIETNCGLVVFSFRDTTSTKHILTPGKDYKFSLTHLLDGYNETLEVIDLGEEGYIKIITQAHHVLELSDTSIWRVSVHISVISAQGKRPTFLSLQLAMPLHWSFLDQEKYIAEEIRKSLE